MKDTQVAFVTGGNRGIGLAFVKELSARNWGVVAGYRDREKSNRLLELADERPLVHPMLAGVTDEMQLQGVRDFIMERYGRLDLLINNAGVNLDSKSDADFVDLEAVRNSFNINAIGPLLTARVLHPALAHAPGARIINIGSQLGSVERSSGKSVPYRMSKAALNMLTKVQAEHYAEDGIVTIVISPGWVRTDMGGSNATLSPEESVSSMLTVIDGLSQDQNGVFVDRQGGTIPF